MKEMFLWLFEEDCFNVLTQFLFMIKLFMILEILIIDNNRNDNGYNDSNDNHNERSA